MAGSGRRRGGLVLILLAMVLLLLIAAAAFLFRNQLFPQSKASELPTPIPSTSLAKIVVLAQPVTRGTVLTPEVLATVNYPQAELVEGLFILNTEEVIGKHTRFDLAAGTPLTPSLLSDKPVGSFAAIQIPKNMVAISFPVNKFSSVAYALQPGDHVNILGSVLLIDIDANFQTRLPNKVGEVSTASGTGPEGAQVATSLTVRVEGGVQGRAELDPSINQGIYVLPSEVQRPRLVSQTLVQDAMVLWVGEYPAGNVDVTQPTPTPAPAAEGQAAQPAPTRPDIITVVVTPQDAVTLNYLLLAGANLNLVMRSAGDEDRNPTEAVTLQYILDQYNMPFPAKLPYSLEPRTDLLPATMPNTAAPASQTPANP